MRDNVCRYCSRPLMSIDYYGEMLIGCIECNRWGRPDDKDARQKRTIGVCNYWKTTLKHCG